MKNISKLLLVAVCFISIGCEIYVPPSRGPNAVLVQSSPVYPVDYNASYCGDDPFDVMPYNTVPWACYDYAGTEYCEWVFADYYGECMEVWHYDWEWCTWQLYDESCYPI